MRGGAMDWEDRDDYIVWDKSLELGIPAIDAQHKKLVALCNSLNESLMNVKSGETKDWQEPFKEALQDAANYVVTHFKSEEVLMKAAHYTSYEEHKHSHDVFTAKVLESVRTFNDASLSDAFQFVRFLYEWILTHVAREDKFYVHQVMAYCRKVQQVQHATKN